MKPIKVNADYETVLFEKREAPKVINQSLEFLSFFLETRPVLTTKTYSKEYLDFVQEISGARPTLVSEGEFENWWGSLEDRTLEEKLNSKITSAKLIQEKGWCPKTQVISQLGELKFVPGFTYLAKNPHGMSGQSFFKFQHPQEVEPFLKDTQTLVIEPFLNRRWDFSHYVFEDEVIAYENLVDEKFRYKGSLFRNHRRPGLGSLRFYQEVPEKERGLFQERLKVIQEYYASLGAKKNYSIDSFVYEDNGLKIRALSEVNYRRTMGRVAYELSSRYAKNSPWTLFFLSKPSQKKGAWKKESGRGILKLSPGDTRFDMFLLAAENEEEGQMLLADGKFPIKI
jgi:hypothetical protein